MSKSIKYSIVVAVYNRPEEMEELLHSLNNQLYKNFELIIVDDGSQMSSRDVYNFYKKKFQISYYFIDNQGPAMARNFGVNKASGEWIIFFDSDCTIPRDYFLVVEKFLNENKIDFFGGPDMMDESFTYLQKSINYSMTSLFTTGGIRGGKRSIDKFLPRSYNMGIKTNAFKSVDGFSNIRQYGEDLDLSYKLLFSNKKSALIPDAKVYHKRRTNLFKFFSQMFKSGKGRRFLDKKYSGTFRIFHFFPSFFVLGFSLILVFEFLTLDEFFILNIIYSIYFLTVFIHSSLLNSNPIIGFMSVLTTITQFIGYGIGYIYSLFRN